MWCNPHMLLRNQLVQLIRDRWVSDICAANLTVTISDENVLRTNGKGGTPVDIASTIRRSRTTDSPHAKPAQQCLVTSIFFEDSSPCYSATWRGIVTHNLSTLEHTRQWTSPLLYGNLSTLERTRQWTSPLRKFDDRLTTRQIYATAPSDFHPLWGCVIKQLRNLARYSNEQAIHLKRTHQGISPLLYYNYEPMQLHFQLSPVADSSCRQQLIACLHPAADRSSQHCDFTPSDHQLPFQLHLTSSIQSHSVVK